MKTAKMPGGCTVVGKVVARTLYTVAFAASLAVSAPVIQAKSSEIAKAIATQPSNSFILRDVRIFDGEAIYENADVLVLNGIIEQLGAVPESVDGVPEYAMGGYTLLPAFIDAHTHNSFPNSVGAREDTLRFGVATHIDMIGDPTIIEAARIAREQLNRTSQADMWSAGRLVSIHSLREGSIEDFISNQIDEGSDFIKLTIYTGEVFKREVPTLTRSHIERIVAAAHARGKMVVAHALTLNEAQLAIDAGVDGLVHLFGNVPIPPHTILALRNNEQFIVSTISYLESTHTGLTPILDDTRIASRLSAQQRNSLIPRPAENAYDDDVVPYIRQNLHALTEAGVPVLIGTDIPNRGTAAGASVHHELELFVQAGVSPLSALRAATSLPANVFGLRDRGRIREGFRADMVVVKGNPVEEITSTRDIIAVWKNGFAVDL